MAGNDAYAVIAGMPIHNVSYDNPRNAVLYDVQRYEDASTLIGPRQPPVRSWRRELSLSVWHDTDSLDAHINGYSVLCRTWQTESREEERIPIPSPQRTMVGVALFGVGGYDEIKRRTRGRHNLEVLNQHERTSRWCSYCYCKLT